MNQIQLTSDIVFISLKQQLIDLYDYLRQSQKSIKKQSTVNQKKQQIKKRVKQIKQQFKKCSTPQKTYLTKYLINIILHCPQHFPKSILYPTQINITLLQNFIQTLIQNKRTFLINSNQINKLQQQIGQQLILYHFGVGNLVRVFGILVGFMQRTGNFNVANKNFVRIIKAILSNNINYNDFNKLQRTIYFITQTCQNNILKKQLDLQSYKLIFEILKQAISHKICEYQTKQKCQQSKQKCQIGRVKTKNQQIYLNCYIFLLQSCTSLFLPVSNLNFSTYLSYLQPTFQTIFHLSQIINILSKHLQQKLQFKILINHMFIVVSKWFCFQFIQQQVVADLQRLSQMGNGNQDCLQRRILFQGRQKQVKHRVCDEVEIDAVKQLKCVELFKYHKLIQNLTQPSLLILTNHYLSLSQSFPLFLTLLILPKQPSSKIIPLYQTIIFQNLSILINQKTQPNQQSQKNNLILLNVVRKGWEYLFRKMDVYQDMRIKILRYAGKRYVAMLRIQMFYSINNHSVKQCQDAQNTRNKQTQIQTKDLLLDVELLKSFFIYLLTQTRCEYSFLNKINFYLRHLQIQLKGYFLSYVLTSEGIELNDIQINIEYILWQMLQKNLPFSSSLPLSLLQNLCQANLPKYTSCLLLHISPNPQYLNILITYLIDLFYTSSQNVPLQLWVGQVLFKYWKEFIGRLDCKSKVLEGLEKWLVKMGYQNINKGKVDYCFFLGILLAQYGQNNIRNYQNFNNNRQQYNLIQSHSMYIKQYKFLSSKGNSFKKSFLQIDKLLKQVIQNENGQNKTKVQIQQYQVCIQLDGKFLAITTLLWLQNQSHIQQYLFPFPTSIDPNHNQSLIPLTIIIQLFQQLSIKIQCQINQLQYLLKTIRQLRQNQIEGFGFSRRKRSLTGGKACFSIWVYQRKEYVMFFLVGFTYLRSKIGHSLLSHIHEQIQQNILYLWILIQKTVRLNYQMLKLVNKIKQQNQFYNGSPENLDIQQNQQQMMKAQRYNLNQKQKEQTKNNYTQLYNWLKQQQLHYTKPNLSIPPTQSVTSLYINSFSQSSISYEKIIYLTSLLSIPLQTSNYYNNLSNVLSIIQNQNIQLNCDKQVKQLIKQLIKEIIKNFQDIAVGLVLQRVKIGDQAIKISMIAKGRRLLQVKR